MVKHVREIMHQRLRELSIAGYNPTGIYLVKVTIRNTKNKVWNMLKVNNKDTRMTQMASFLCLYC